MRKKLDFIFAISTHLAWTIMCHIVFRPHTITVGKENWSKNSFVPEIRLNEYTNSGNWIFNYEKSLPFFTKTNLFYKFESQNSFAISLNHKLWPFYGSHRAYIMIPDRTFKPSFLNYLVTLRIIICNISQQSRTHDA